MCIPIALHGLGVQRFSVLSLAWVLLAYLTIFDVGLGRAAVRFLSAALTERRYDQIAMIVWTTVGVELVMGLIGGGLLAVATPFLVVHFLQVDKALLSETTSALYVLGSIVPFLLALNGLKGVLEANQRFDLVNLVRTFYSSATFVAPALGVVLHWDLPRILLMIGVSIVVAVVAYLLLSLRVCPGLRTRPTIDLLLLGRIIRFGGWVTASSILVPLIAYSDRLLITGLASVGGLAYYSVPYEVTTRIQVVPNSLGSVLYPAFSAIPPGKASGPEIGRLYAESIKYLLLLMAPIMLAVALYAHWILSVWIDPGFADRSTLIMQLLAFGVLLNSLAFVPVQLLDARDRPDLRAKVFLMELAWYVPVAGLLIAHFGLIGAAWSVVLRGGFDVVVFFLVAWPLSGLEARGPDVHGLVRAGLVCLVLAVPSAVLVMLGGGLNVVALASALLLVLAVVGILWRLALDAEDRARLKGLLKRTTEGV